MWFSLQVPLQNRLSIIHEALTNETHVTFFAASLQYWNMLFIHLVSNYLVVWQEFSHGGNFWWLFRDFFNIRMIFLNFWVVSIFDQPSLAAALSELFSLMKPTTDKESINERPWYKSSIIG